MNNPMLMQLGKYQLVEILHQGKSSVVYKAYQPSLERYVVVKVLTSNNDPQFAARFKRAARTSASLQHPHILPTYDYGEEGGVLFLVLQHIEGGLTLRSLLGQPLNVALAAQIMSDFLGALEYAHQRGIIHRNIKPANIMMRSPTWPLLADFGIAKLRSEGQPSASSDMIVGTPAYMSPEQATNAPLDTRTDLYAAGVVLYEMLTGQVPFEAGTPTEMLTKHIYEPPAAPSRRNPRVPAAMDKLLLRALAKSPDDRFQSAAEMAEAVRQAAAPSMRPEDPPSQISSMFQTGAQAFEAGQWTLAVELLGQVVARDPEREDALDMLEVARAEQQRAKDEGKQLVASIAGKEQAQKLARLAREKQQSGDLAGAVADYRAAQALAPAGALRDTLAAAVAEVEALLARPQPQPAQAPRCPQCQREVQPGWLACPYCRAALAAAPAAAATAAPTMQAPAQPASVAPGPAPEAGAAPVPAEQAARPARRRWPGWVAVLIALALLGVAGSTWALAFRSPSAPATPTAASLQVVRVANTAAPVAAIATAAPAATQIAPTAPPAPTAAPADTATASPASPTEPPAPAEPPAPTAPPPDALVNLDALKLRDGPGTTYTFQRVYAQGTALKIVGKESSGVWLQAQAPDGQVGWMRAQDLTLNIALDGVPLVAAPPTPPPPTPKPTAPRPTATPAPAPAEPPTATPLPAEPPTATPLPAEPPTPVPPAPATPTDKGGGGDHSPAPTKKPAPPTPRKQPTPSK